MEKISENAIKIKNVSFTWGKMSDREKKSEDKNVEESKNKKNLFINKLDSTNYQKPLKTEGEEEAQNLLSVLKNISLTIKKGEFIGVIGEVGSGKSSLIQAIMNNLIIIQEDENGLNSDNSKKITVNGSIAYSAQLPWIQNDTLKNNILFFKEFDEYRYQKVLEVCQLAQDIKILPGKDQTELGEKGINLSGGQKARVSLARAIYSDRDIYLLDDPICALDADVSKNIFSQCLLGYLKNKTRILATHNIQYLNFFDRIIWLEKGKIIFNGTIQELKKQEFLASFISINNSSIDNDTSCNSDDKVKKVASSSKLSKTTEKLCFNSLTSINNTNANAERNHDFFGAIFS